MPSLNFKLLKIFFLQVSSNCKPTKMKSNIFSYSRMIFLGSWYTLFGLRQISTFKIISQQSVHLASAPAYLTSNYQFLHKHWPLLQHGLVRGKWAHITMSQLNRNIEILTQLRDWTNTSWITFLNDLHLIRGETNTS